MSQINTNVLVVTKLIEDTKNGVIKWNYKSLDIVLPGESQVLDLVYTAKFKDKYLRLFRYKTRIISNYQGDQWKTMVRLEVTDINYTNSLWTFPEMSSIADLYNTVRHKTADIRVFFDGLFNNLVIHSAMYGANGQYIDVANQLSQKVIDDKLAVRVDNLIGGDPIVGVGKNITVKYSFDGEMREKSCGEGQDLILP
jgi:hypothetical protein